MNVLRSERHRIYGQHMNNVSLSSFDSMVDTVTVNIHRVRIYYTVRSLNSGGPSVSAVQYT